MEHVLLIKKHHVEMQHAKKNHIDVLPLTQAMPTIAVNTMMSPLASILFPTSPTEGNFTPTYCFPCCGLALGHPRL